MKEVDYTEYFGIHYDLTLSHHGIKGQSWGVKNGPPYPLSYGQHSPKQIAAGTSGWTEKARVEKRHDEVISSKRRGKDLVLKRGTKLQRITYNESQNTKRGVYMSFTDQDRELYTGVLGRLRLSYLAKKEGDVKLSKVDTTLAKKLKVPSTDTAANMYKDFYQSHKEACDAMVTEHQKNIRKRTYTPPKNGQLTMSDYYKFNDALGYGTGSKYGKVINDFYEYAKKRGYGAIRDENDSRLGTFHAEAPLIVFDVEQIAGRVSSKSLTPKEVYDSYVKAMPKKTLRSVLSPGNTAPFAAGEKPKVSEKTAETKTIFADNYTLEDLGLDWGVNRLTNRQIAKVNQLMLDGSNHDEAVKSVSSIRNVAIDKILTKFGV